MVSLELMDNQVGLDHVVIEENKDLPDNQDHPDKEENQVFQDLMGNLVQQDKEEKMVSQELQDQQVHKDNQDLKVHRELRAHLDNQVHEVKQAPEVKLVNLERQDQTDDQVRRKSEDEPLASTVMLSAHNQILFPVTDEF